MTFKPTKQRQVEWAKKHLNAGVCPANRDEWRRCIKRCSTGELITACFEALEWLDSTDIKTLAEAWDRCTHPDWLLWMLRWMEPDERDVDKCVVLWDYLLKVTQSPTTFVNYPWSLSWRTPAPAYALYLAMLEMQDYEEGHREDTADLAIATDMIKKLWGNPWRRRPR